MTEEPQRGALVTRNSRETQLDCEVRLDTGGVHIDVGTGLPFLDHLLEQVARYGGFDLVFKGAGDVEVDPHHLMEDAGIVLGQALDRAMGDRAGITRFAHAYAPLDESLARVVVDLGKRPYLSYNLPLVGPVGTLEAETIEEWWKAFAIHVGAAIHVDLIRGRNRHHIAESAAKALGLALRQAMTLGGGPGVPSSKGLLG
jgi:imidazoleglycerol-phosphate dehydratase